MLYDQGELCIDLRIAKINGALYKGWSLTVIKIWSGLLWTLVAWVLYTKIQYDPAFCFTPHSRLTSSFTVAVITASAT